MLHLDSVYRNRYQLFYLDNGKVFDSRKVNWRQVEWEKVIKIYTNVRSNEYWVDCKFSTFLFFLNYRTTGEVWNANVLKVNNSLEKKKIAEWNIGFTDGIYAYMKDIDFKNGKLLRKSKILLDQLSEHIHPRVKHLINKEQIIIGA